MEQDDPYKISEKAPIINTIEKRTMIGMLYFVNDYCEGAHEAILKRLIETNMEKLDGYGMDPYCESAKEKIREACECPNADVTFLVGGTQTNAVVIGSMLNRYEGVVSAKTGHVSVHEAGAIEYTGHKVLEIPEKDGKIDAQVLRQYLETFYQDGKLAQTLSKLEIGDAIPPELYGVVAEILVFVDDMDKMKAKLQDYRRK